MGDIDKIWGDCQKWHQDMASLTKEISVATEHGKDNDKKLEALKSALSTAEKKTGDLSVQISQMIERLESVTFIYQVLWKKLRIYKMSMKCGSPLLPHMRH